MFISWLWELLCTESVICDHPPRKPGSNHLNLEQSRRVGLYVDGQRLADLPPSSFSDSLELLDSVSYLRNVLASPGQDLMLLFHGPASQSHIGSPCSITAPPPCVWPWLHLQPSFKPQIDISARVKTVCSESCTALQRGLPWRLGAYLGMIDFTITNMCFTFWVAKCFCS